MTLALFDLDNTLLNGDSDHAWGMYLAEIGAVDAAQQQKMQDYFYQQYLLGSLDINEFLEFQLAPLAQHSIQQLHSWRTRFLDQVIQPMVESGKVDLLCRHRERGDEILIITATNDFITRPIADLLGVETLIATTAEFANGRYTGRCKGTPCYQYGKVERINEWLLKNRKSLSDSYFYSDSFNDLPLLELVKYPIAVAPDERLREYAAKLNWQIID